MLFISCILTHFYCWYLVNFILNKISPHSCLSSIFDSAVSVLFLIPLLPPDICWQLMLLFDLRFYCWLNPFFSMIYKAFINNASQSPPVKDKNTVFLSDTHFYHICYGRLTGQAIIFCSCGFYFLLSFFPHLFSVVADWMSTILPHMMWH